MTDAMMDRKKSAIKRNIKLKKKKSALQGEKPLTASMREERPLMVRVLTIGVASYLAQKVWTKRKILTDGWYKEEQTEMERNLVTLFEFLSSMGLIFVIGIVVGVGFDKVAKWVAHRKRGFSWTIVGK